jgi:hypothetical protein
MVLSTADEQLAPTGLGPQKKLVFNGQPRITIETLEVRLALGGTLDRGKLVPVIEEHLFDEFPTIIEAVLLDRVD